MEMELLLSRLRVVSEDRFRSAALHNTDDESL